MPAASTGPYQFGDVLALARLARVRQISARLEGRGYHGYRRTDAAALRLLLAGPRTVGQAGTALGVTRQAARKVVRGLESRGYATASRDPGDSRNVQVVLTPAGRAYARAVVQVLRALDRDLERRIGRAQLVAADAVLRASVEDGAIGRRLAQVPPP